MNEENIKKIVREKYAQVARENRSCCGTSSPGSEAEFVTSQSQKTCYTQEEIRDLPEDANLGLGCGNPVALASLKSGETVLDLGSGAGIDCFFASQKVGPEGRVIGVDMTPEMVKKASAIAKERGYENVEFRLGEIENLPVANDSVNVIISNCVINLSPDKQQVFKEAFRVLRPGGRMMVADIVLLAPLPEFIKTSVEAYVGCIAGALLKEDYLTAIQAAGFIDIRVVEETSYPADSFLHDPFVRSLMDKAGKSENQMKDIIRSVISMQVYALKPLNKN